MIKLPVLLFWVNWVRQNFGWNFIRFCGTKKSRRLNLPLNYLKLSWYGISIVQVTLQDQRSNFRATKPLTGFHVNEAYAKVSTLKFLLYLWGIENCQFDYVSYFDWPYIIESSDNVRIHNFCTVFSNNIFIAHIFSRLVNCDRFPFGWALTIKRYIEIEFARVGI